MNTPSSSAYTSFLVGVSAERAATRRRRFTLTIRLAKWLLLVELVISMFLAGSLAASASDGYFFNLLLAFIALTNSFIAGITLRRLQAGLSASALVAHALWKGLQLALLFPSLAVLTIALVKEGHLGDASRRTSTAALLLSIAWTYGFFSLVTVCHSSRLGRDIWRRKANALTSFYGSRCSSMRSVISFISAQDATSPSAQRNNATSRNQADLALVKRSDRPLLLPLQDFTSSNCVE